MADETPLPAESSPKNITDILSTIKTSIEEGNATVKDKVVAHFAKIEIDSRVEKTIAAMDSLKLAQKELQKVKPDQASYDGQGNETSSSYSKAAMENRRKALEKVTRIETALLEVFNNGNFEKLLKLQTEKSADAAA